jgi:NADH-quinone oxidoreductase subunit L
MHRGGLFTIIAIAMYVGAILTAIYSLRAVFLVFHGEPCDEAKELENGHLAHGDHTNPATGEHEDTEVGFPGADHHIAEREGEMKVAMGILAFLSIVAGAIQIPGLDHYIETWLEPVFEASHDFHDIPSVATQWFDLGIGAVIALTGITIAWWIWSKNRGFSEALANRYRPLNRFLTNAWYFDALYDKTIVRPIRGFANFCNNVVERYVVDGIVTGTVGLVREGGERVRSLQSGLARIYALTLIAGTVAMALYFVVIAK